MTRATSNVKRITCNAERATHPMNTLFLCTDAFGGRGGIAQFNRDLCHALTAEPLSATVTALPRVASRVVDGHLVSARPTYHYRLPNCQVDEPRWTIAGEWNRWVLVERLAAVPEAVEELGHAYLQLAPSAMNMHRRYWLDGITRWIEGVEWDRVLPSG